MADAQGGWASAAEAVEGGHVLGDEAPRAGRRGAAASGERVEASQCPWADAVGGWRVLEEERPRRVLELVRAGPVPDPLRGLVWWGLGRAGSLQAKSSGLYGKLLGMRAVPQEEAIARDIKRTFAKHRFFEDSTGLGQLELFQVLRAYAAYDLEVGYCQGMGFLVALFLCYMPAESAFWLLVAVTQRSEFEMRQLYRPGMPKFRGAMQRLNKLVETHAPALARHFAKLGLEPGMFASQWFMTLFAYNFPLGFVARVWDLFFAQGWEPIYRVALALLVEAQPFLLERPFEEVMVYLRDLPLSVDTDHVIARAMGLDATAFPTTL